MFTKSVLSQADVQKILAACATEAKANSWAVSIAVCDDGGHLLGMLRLDHAAPISAHICQAKARTAALGRRESKVYEDIINGGRTSFLSAPLLEGMLEGGVPILVDGQVVAAVGVSGVKSSEDVQIAKAGIATVS
jgi:glc operon protein GlcG